jgi:ParB-like chromosome segregation protein Spo0J
MIDSLEPAGNTAGNDQCAGDGTYLAADAADGEPEIMVVPLAKLRLGESPRLCGSNRAYAEQLAETDAQLPPILIDRRSMQVIDGTHRVLAATMRGQETIEVRFFDGSAADAFLRAVELNIRHGWPLSQADRRAAAARIIASHPQMSDRALAQSVGLAAKTVATIRRRCADDGPQPWLRVGKDGRTRPMNSAQGRLRAAAVLAARPEASLRDVAQEAGVSPGTVRDVRKRLERGEEAVPGRHGAPRTAAADGERLAELGESACPRRLAVPRAPALVLEKLVRDPSLRQTENGRRLLRLLRFSAVGAQEWPGVISAVPPHCAIIVVQLARQYGRMWLQFAEDLERRARADNLSVGGALNGQRGA